jgi:hypothetical protein
VALADTMVWSSPQVSGRGRYGHDAVTIDGNLFLVGGIQEQCTTLTMDIEYFDFGIYHHKQ